MATIGLDTSVVLRLLVGLPAGQAQAARTRLEQAVDELDTVIVTDLVIAEAYFALHHHYGVPKDEARMRLHAFASGGVVTLDPEDSAVVFAREGGAGFVDRLIHARHRMRGGTTLTFERRQSRLEGAVQLQTAPSQTA